MSIDRKMLILVITSFVIISVPAVLAAPLDADAVTDAVDSPDVGILAVDDGLLSAASYDSITLYYEDIASYAGTDMYARLGGVTLTILERAWPGISQTMEIYAVPSMSITAAVEGTYEVDGRVVDRYVINTYMGDRLVDLSDLGLADQIRITGSERTSLLAVFSEAGTVIAEGSIPLSHSGSYNLGYVNDSDAFGMVLTAILIVFVASIPMLALYSYRRNRMPVVEEVKVTKLIYCPDCGMNIDPTYGFCIHCGLTLKKATA